MIYVSDSSRVWHVAKTGSDANSGHAGQYPVNLANDAKLTIGAAVSGAANGDAIIIWPGTYEEGVDARAKELRFIGIQRGSTIIAPAGDAVPMRLGPNSYAGHLSFICPAASSLKVGLKIENPGCTVEDCYAYGDADGLTVDYACYNTRLISCHFTSPWDGANLGGTSRIFAERCLFETTGTNPSVNSHGCFNTGSGVYRDSIFRAAATGTSAMDLRACSIDGSKQAVFAGCQFYVSAPTQRTGVVAAFSSLDSLARAVLNGCSFYSAGNGASGGSKDILQTAGTVVVNGCAYSTSKLSGTIIQSDSNWANALAGALFTGSEADLLIRAAKMLTNKAVQDKLSGAIRYYDDDGQTVILTHTPGEDGASLTRTVS